LPFFARAAHGTLQGMHRAAVLSPRRTLAALSTTLLIAAALAWPQGARAQPKTVCTITINSSDEKQSFQRHLPPDQYRFVELVQPGQTDWLASACRRGVTCDALIVSGHFDDGTEFYTDRLGDRDVLTVHELEQASCSASCGGLFSQLKEVYLFGCNTLQSVPRHTASAEIARSLRREGHTAAEAEQIAAQLSQRYGQSNRDRLRHIFKDVPVLYGFSSKAPLGRTAGPLLERYFQSAPAGEVASGRPSAALLALFGPTSMVTASGLTAADPHASLRSDVCGFADERPSDAQKVDYLHDVLRRDVTDVRMFLDHLERYAGSLDATRRAMPATAAALASIERDQATRDRFLGFARDADEASVQVRMMALARSLGWLTPAQERDEFVQMIAQRMSAQRFGKHEVDLVCASPLAHRDEPGDDLAQRVQSLGAARTDSIAHAAALACLGSRDAHQRTVRALTSEHEDDIAIAQVYLRHRPLTDVDEQRAVVRGIGRIGTARVQLRALEAIARQRIVDPQSLQAVAQLFTRARSLDVQRAIADILIRSDRRTLAQGDLASLLQRHRLKSPNGSDVIDVLIRLLQTA
jgi:hypothetical protein